MEMATTKRRSVRQLAGRKRSKYWEPDTDDELVQDSESDDGAYAEAARTQRKKPAKQRRNKPQTRSKATKTKDKPTSKRKARWPPVLPPAGQKSKADKSQAFHGPSDGKIPAWTSLPLDILREVFIYASRPDLKEVDATAKDIHARWLMRTARTCRAFAVPALEAYYLAPSVIAPIKLHNLLDLLQTPTEHQYTKYRVKIRRLKLNVQNLAYVAHSRSPFDLSTLVKELPRLQELDIVHPAYEPPFRAIKFQKWTYPSDLFETLDASGQRLKSWRWTRNMVPVPKVDVLYDWMTEVHRGKSFEYLERLVICGFNFSDSATEGPTQSENDTTYRPPDLASAVSALPRLKDLTFVSCDIIIEDFLNRIPKNLERLELSNCLEITSDMLQAYLMAGGAHLRELVLDYNPALNLAFLPSLKALCPRLEVLKMDFAYYSERDNYNDASALYDEVLTVDEVPSWPASMQKIELLHLQKWSAEGGKNLFSSLVDSAEELPNLRHLTILAHIDIPWRDRAGFRDRWIDSLRRAFLRRCPDPPFYMGSLRQMRLWNAKQTDRNDSMLSLENDSGDKERALHDRLSHVRVTPRKAPADPVTSDPDTTAERGLRPRRSNRTVALKPQTESATPRTTDDSENEESDEADKSLEDGNTLQGLCEVVDIRIDNQRPRENQYTEANFLDSEPSGDEDWNEAAENARADEGYAW